MRTLTRACILTVLALAVVSAIAPQALAQTEPPSAGSLDAVAEGNDLRITKAELAESIAARAAQLEEQIYELQRQQLDELIGTRLIEAEARRRGLTSEQLLALEVTARVATVSDNDVEAFIQANRERMPPDVAAARPQVRAYLERTRAAAAREAFVAPLRQRADVRILLTPPAQYRATLELANAPVKGPASATVTIVEFADFNCPYCRSVQSTLEQLLARYPSDVRLVFKHFPLDAIHPTAREAAAASWCAHQQGMFWAFHDAYYAAGASNPNSIDLREVAKRAGLALDLWQGCVISGHGSAGVQADIEQGAHCGVSGTPAFFINGRPLSGALPLEVFSNIVEEELASTRKSEPSRGQ